MFKLKSKSKLEGVTYHPGIYQITLPYLTGQVKNKHDIVPVSYCDVEIHVGDQRDLDKGILITVIISDIEGGMDTIPFIESITTKVLNYIDEIVYDKTLHIMEHIRFIQRNYYPSEEYSLLDMNWDNKNGLSAPSWTRLDNDWIIEGNKLEDYSRRSI